MMSDLATTSTAPNNPTPPGPLTQRQAEPTRHDNQQPRGVISDAAYDQLTTDADRDRYARVSKGGNDRGAQWQERATLPSETTPPAAADPAKPGDPAAKPALIPGQTYQFGDLELSGQQILDLLKHKGETELRRAAVPAEASQYRLPEKFAADALPPGFDFRFDTADPALAAAKNWAHADGLSQDQFDGLMTNYAAMEAKKQAVYIAAQKAELAKLGDRATMRVTALDTFFTGQLGAEDAKQIRGGMYSAGIVTALERLVAKFTSQGAASFSQAHREPAGQPGRVSQAEYDAMSSAERYAYSKSFDQRQFRT
jgi:hypothetical protein